MEVTPPTRGRERMSDTGEREPQPPKPKSPSPGFVRRFRLPWGLGGLIVGAVLGYCGLLISYEGADPATNPLGSMLYSGLPGAFLGWLVGVVVKSIRKP